MPRTSRATVAGYCYHLINRGNNRAQRFNDLADYREFLWLMAEASDRIPMPVLGACLMPNHVHLLVQPMADNDLARWTHWLFGAYSRRFHKRYGTTGRAWENRYRAFAIQGDMHFLTVLRYVERNAVRANLVTRAENWQWGSLCWRGCRSPPIALAASPVALPSDWVSVVNEPHTEQELAAIRNSVNRQCPFGSPEWAAKTGKALGLEYTLAGREAKRSV